MNSKENLIIGSLLHDIGKVIYRISSADNHSALGVDFLQTRCNVNNPEILNCVKYHHKDKLVQAELAADDMAYIVYLADNIAAFSDRRDRDKSKGSYTGEVPFERDIPLESVFNILNGNRETCTYKLAGLNHDEGINFPRAERQAYSTYDYQQILEQIKDKLLHLEYSKAYIDSFLSLLEGYLTYVPSATSKQQICDISLYDHMKLTAAIASCIYDYLVDKGYSDFSDLLKHSDKYYQEEMFYLYSLDFSGIQDFIYKIIESKALKSLRTRSFYLEILMEVVIDDILSGLELSRSNLLYSGGGGSYLLLPNTEKAKNIVEKIRSDFNQWIMDIFGIDIFLAGGGSPASANNFKNVPMGSYRDIFNTAAKAVSQVKMARYSLAEINRLNSARREYGQRECKICQRVDFLSENSDENLCTICAAIIQFSNQIVKLDFFAVEHQSDQAVCLPLNNHRVLVPYSKSGLTQAMESDLYIRSYSKNNIHIGHNLTTNLWIGDYYYDDVPLENEGINRIALLRADVDNLGTSFKNGFSDDYISLTRSAAFSRHMSIFFKYHINYILSHGEKNISAKNAGNRQVKIIYAGGDDLLIVGRWSDVIGAAIDLRNNFALYSVGSLSLSAGVGIYREGYPIKRMALEVQELEDKAKSNTYEVQGVVKEKDSICIFDSELTFSWHQFVTRVIDEKFCAIKSYMDNIPERGMAFLYKIVELLQGEDKLNLARLYYLLTRLKPEKRSLILLHEQFSQQITLWAQSDEDRKELKAGIYIYVYRERN